MSAVARVGFAVVFAWFGLARGVGAEETGAVGASAGDSRETPLLATQLLQEELQFALETAHHRIEALEQQLQARGPAGQQGSDGLAVALAAANREAEQYRVRYRDLLVRVESLGLATVRSDSALEDRILKAVRERQHYLEKHEQAQEQIMRLSEAVVDYLKVSTSSNPEVRLKLEGELRRADEVLGFGQIRAAEHQRQRSLGEGQVVGYKSEFRLAVIDIGVQSGVKVGMPLNIVRKDRLVGTALVVDVRDNVAGALVQEYFREGDKVEVQDRVEPRTIGATNL
jgi:hypothetical protein